MDYSWNVKDLKNRLRRLEKLEFYAKNEEEKSSLLIEIEDLRDDISQFTDQDKEFVEATLGEKMEYISDFLDDHSYAWDPCLTFAESTGAIDKIYTFQDLDITIEDILCFTHDFYRDILDKELFKVFLNIFATRKSHLRFFQNVSFFQGQMIHIKTFNETFLESQYKKNIGDIITLIHEYGHGIHASINHDQQYNMNYYVYLEVLSTFFELVAYHYFISKSILKEETIKAKFELWRSNLMYADEITPLLKIMQIEEYKNVKHLKSISQRKLGINAKTFEDSLSLKNVYATPYVFGMIIAIELYNLYLKDKDLTMHKFF